jgi:RNA polymerase sigma-32 factor
MLLGMKTTRSTPSAFRPVSSPAPRITREEEVILVTQAQGEGAAARTAANKLVAAHTPYMRQTATRYARWVGGDSDDYLSACFEGFMEAIKRFDTKRGTRLLTYANSWFLHAMQKNSETDNCFGQAASGSEERVIAAIGRMGTFDPEALAQEAGTKVRTAVNAVSLYRSRAVSLDAARALVDGEEVCGLYNWIASDQPLADDQMAHLEEREAERVAVVEALAELDPRSRGIVETAYMADEPQSFAAIGRTVGVSRERVRQLDARARQKLHNVIVERMAAKNEAAVAA